MSRVALVVGINTYRYGGLRNLSAPSEDAEAIAQRLEKYGDFDSVIRLPEAIAAETKKPFVGKEMNLNNKALKNALVQLFNPKSSQVPGTALFYFSGHGLWETDGVEEGFLATSDVDPDKGFNGLSLRWLRDLLQASQIKQQIVWLDCCHSGAILNVAEANPGESGQASDRCFIAASRDFEKSYQAIASPYSVLTKALLDGLDSPQVSAKGLNNYELVTFLNNAMRGELQQPTFSNFGQPIALIRRWEEIKTQKQDVEIDAKCPYKGLAYFEDDDARFFFGRTKLTDLLLDRLRQNNFLALLGASGSGKSSVLRAGLLNQLRQGRQLSGSDRWEFHIMLPGEHPLESLAEAFVDSESGKNERATQLTDARSLLKKETDGLRNLVATSKAPRVVLVIDQFEESFTLCQDLGEREKFFFHLINALEIKADKFCLAIAMRADFFGKCVEREYGGLAKQIEAHLVAVTPMNDAELRDAIAKPAELVGAEVEDDLVKAIVKDVAGAPANLPSMQFALEELWKRCEGNLLTLKIYNRELGGIVGALEKLADAVYAGFTNELEQKAVKHIFLALTHLGEGTEDTRRRVNLKNLQTEMFPLEVIEKVVKKLADEKLVVTSALAGEDGKLQDVATVDVAHEAIIRHWKKLRIWLDENRENLRKQRKLEDRAEEWQQAGKSKYKADLLQGYSLRDAKEFIKAQKNDGNITLQSLAIDFVKASEKKQRSDRLKLASIFLVFPLIGSITALHFYILNLATAILTSDDCKQNPEIRLLLEYKLLIGHREHLEEVKLCNEDLSGIKLQKAVLWRADFRRTNLAQSDFQGAYLEEADFRKSDLYKVNFNDASLKNAKFDKDSYLFETNFLNSRNLTENLIAKSILCGTKLPSNIHLDPNRDCKTIK
jgi:uncharacterized protein YjbI with pentapeptide repeats